MKKFTKLALLVIFALTLTLTACQRPASRAPVNTPTPSDEVPFPFDTPDPVSVIRTQTAVALNPVIEQPTETVVVQVETAVEAQQEDAEVGGGIQATATPEPAVQQEQVQQYEIPEVTRPASYALQKGEWPICIARRFNLELTSFLATNGMNMYSKPGVGTVLQIPSSGTWNDAHGSRALKAHPTTYSVSAGETIYTISCGFGDVAPEQILAANGLTNISEIQSGMTLQIP